MDRMCNECGNCAVFCPYDSAPYRNKFTLFLTREGFDESAENQGFLPLEGRKVLVRLDGKVFEADLDGQNQTCLPMWRNLHPDSAEELRLPAVKARFTQPPNCYSSIFQQLTRQSALQQFSIVPL